MLWAERMVWGYVLASTSDVGSEGWYIPSSRYDVSEGNQSLFISSGGGSTNMIQLSLIETTLAEPKNLTPRLCTTHVRTLIHTDAHTRRRARVNAYVRVTYK